MKYCLTRSKKNKIKKCHQSGKDRDQVAWVPGTPSITGSAPSHRGSGYSCRLPRTQLPMFCFVN